MSQNINLLNPALRRQRTALSFATLVKSAGLVLVVLFGAQFILQHQVSGLAAELAGLESAGQQRTAHADQLKAQAAQRRPDPTVEADITRLEREVRQAREAMGALKIGTFGDPDGFSEYLRAFSRQSLSGLWLTGFTIAGAGDVAIHGRVIRPELVPSYIRRLNREKVLAGRSFAHLEMSQPAAKGIEPKDGAQAFRFLEFSLATLAPAGTGRTP
jgi:hypothetical protein